MCVLTRSLLKCKQADELLSTARRLCSITYNANSELVNSCLVKHPFVRLRLQLQLHLQPNVNPLTSLHTLPVTSAGTRHPTIPTTPTVPACVRVSLPPGSRQHHRTSPCFCPRVPRPPPDFPSSAHVRPSDAPCAVCRPPSPAFDSAPLPGDPGRRVAQSHTPRARPWPRGGRWAL